MKRPDDAPGHDINGRPIEQTLEEGAVTLTAEQRAKLDAQNSRIERFRPFLRSSTVPTSISEIQNQLLTQDNRATDAPIFIVQQQVREYGVDPDYGTAGHVWIDDYDSENVADEDEAADLDRREDAGEETDGWTKVHYRERWDFVTACFTEQGCKDYLTINGHNLKKTRIYADGSFRNEEFRAVRELLMSDG